MRDEARKQNEQAKKENRPGIPVDQVVAMAEALVPNELLDSVALIGPRERIIERLSVWKEAGKRGEVGSMLLSVQDPVVLELLAQEML